MHQIHIIRSYWESSDVLEVSGWVLQSRLAYVRARGGQNLLERVLDRLTEAQRKIWQDFDINGWYDIRAIEPLERAVAEVLGKPPEEVYMDMGAFSAERAFDREKGIYKRFLGQKPQVFLKIAAKWQNGYYNTGLTEYYPTGVSSCFIRTRYIPYSTRPNCVSNLGFFKRSIELLGGRGVQAEEGACVMNDDVWCQWNFSWEEAEP